MSFECLSVKSVQVIRYGLLGNTVIISFLLCYLLSQNLERHVNKEEIQTLFLFLLPCSFQLNQGKSLTDKTQVNSRNHIGTTQTLIDQPLLSQNKQDKFDEFISPYEGLFERNMLITKYKSHLSNP